ncbi:tetratricopeptide repeat protein [Candidatus Woesearchaeota archaeon]|nr:tetratricopeptide repeat protein [Candidatus Woesearchaeota archaeon]
MAKKKSINLNSKKYFEQGKKHLRNRDYVKAKDAFEKVVDLDSNYPKAYSYLIPVYHALNMDANAVQAFKNAIEIDKEDLAAHYNLAMMSLKKQQYLTAKKLFKKVIDANKRHVGAIFGFGIASYRTGNMAAAKKCFEFVSMADPKNGIAKKYLEHISKQRLK